MQFCSIVDKAISRRASDIHITVNAPIAYRIDGVLSNEDRNIVDSNYVNSLVDEILNKEQLDELSYKGEVEISYSLPDKRRFRLSIFKQNGYYAIAVRIIPMRIPSIEELGLPQITKKLSALSKGLVLVTGPAGSGKSTTLAAMINYINNKKRSHIITLEDPIEYLHQHKNSIINQREIGKDSLNYSNGLKAALRQDPDVIYVGEMRDQETISIVLTAAETGHLVLSTIHTSSAAKTIDRIIDIFPSIQQKQIRLQFSSAIKGIISQTLLPRNDGEGRVLACEIMIGTKAISNLIREGKTHQIDNAIITGSKYGMQALSSSISENYKKGLIDYETFTNETMDYE